MYIEAIRTHRIECGELLEQVIDRYASDFLAENVVLAITSKIISICQNRIVSKSTCSKEELVKREADAILDDKNPYDFYLTIKDNVLMPAAGIDESNANDMYILHPKDVQKTALHLWQYLRTKYSIKHLGILITDSTVTFLRRGVTGFSLGWCGFEPVYSYIGQPDLYNRVLRVTQINLLDSLASTAVLVMGEGAEQTPMAIIKDIPKITFLDRPLTTEEENSIKIPMEEDLYSPLLTAARWLKKE